MSKETNKSKSQSPEKNSGRLEDIQKNLKHIYIEFSPKKEIIDQETEFFKTNKKVKKI